MAGLVPLSCGAVGVQHLGAGLLQVPVAPLKSLLALGARLQPQPEQLLYLQHERGVG